MGEKYKQYRACDYADDDDNDDADDNDDGCDDDKGPARSYKALKEEKGVRWRPCVFFLCAKSAWPCSHSADFAFSGVTL